MHKAHWQQPFHGRLIILSRSFIENLTKIPPMTLIDSGSRSLVSFHGFLLPRTRFLGMGTIIFIVAPSLVWTLFQLPSKFSHETCTRKGTSFLSVARLATNPTSLDHSTAWPCRSNSTAWARLPHKSSTAHMATCSAAAFYALNHIVNNRLHLCECARHLHDSAVNPAPNLGGTESTQYSSQTMAAHMLHETDNKFKE